MSMSSFEVAMQTLASVLSEYMKKKNGVPVMTNDSLEKLMKEQFPDFEKKKICPGVYEFKIPMSNSQLNMSLTPLEPTFQSNIDVLLRFQGIDVIDLVTEDNLEILMLIGVA